MILRWLAAILASGCRSVRIAGNTVDQGRAQRGDGFTIGIASDVAFEQLDVTENTVRRLSDETRAEEDPSQLGDSIGVAVGELPGVEGVRHVVVTEEMRYVVTEAEIYAYRIPRGGGTTAVRGNTVDGVGGRTAAYVVTQAPCVFSDNICNLIRSGQEDQEAPVVGLDVATLVLADNQVRSEFREAAAVQARVGASAANGDPALTALGNITEGGIEVNGAPLAPPWEPLNIRLT